MAEIIDGGWALFPTKSVIDSKSIISVATYADLLLSAVGDSYKQFVVLADETNDGLKTRYEWDGEFLNVVLTQRVEL
jgi:hypothetical protein